jgi:hypothetical protein
MSAKGSNPDFLLGTARPLPPSADIGPGGQSVGQTAQFGLAPRHRGRHREGNAYAKRHRTEHCILPPCQRLVPD